MGKIFDDGRAVSDGVLQLGISRVRGRRHNKFYKSAIPARGEDPLRYVVHPRAAAVVHAEKPSGGYGLFSYYTRFPFQRPLPCIARSCIVSTGV